MLTISDLTYRIGGRLILEDASATIMQGWKVGLVGANGAGKSTLFKLIAGELHADGGEISLGNKLSLGMVRQDIDHGEMPLLEVVLAADVERANLLRQVETEQDMNKLGDVYDRLMEIDAYAAPARASIILAGLGFKEAQLAEPLSGLSGGWQMRVALAAALFRQPDVLLLDEPTNHLDIEAVMWLESYLASYPNTLIVISHDRELLNKCTDHIIHVENKKLVSYTGNYDTFERERAERMGLQQKMHEKQQAQRAHMQAFVDRFKAKASKARQAQSRMKALEKMDVIDAVMADRAIKFNFPQPEELGSPMVRLDNAEIGYAKGKPILKGMTERIAFDDRIALLGANGNGKSTLIKLLAGKLEPLAGEIVKAGKLRIGYFSQHQTDELDVTDTPVQALARLMKGQPETAVRAKLGQFKFGKELADNAIGKLSGGEKARLLFAMMSHQAPHLLLLDEPTNHLDMESREALVQALNAFTGAVVMVSHDPSMVERVADRLWLVHGGKCKDFEGDLADYREHVLEQRREERRADKKASKGEVVPKGPTKDEIAAKKKQHPKLVKAIDEAEKAVAKLMKQKDKLEAELADPACYNDKKRVKEVNMAHAKLVAEISDAEAVWLSAQEAFDEA